MTTPTQAVKRGRERKAVELLVRANLDDLRKSERNRILRTGAIIANLMTLEVSQTHWVYIIYILRIRTVCDIRHNDLVAVKRKTHFSDF